MNTGIVHRARVALVGERDAVADQLRDIARQGRGMAGLAHAAAFLLIILFSAGSLIGLSSEAFVAVLRTWQTTGQLDIPAAISVVVSTLLVLCMDIGLVYAASMLRLLATRHAGAGERWVHVAVLIAVSLLEAATYGYMAWLYDRPTSWIAWTLIIARALSAPLLATYLSLARALPVTARDILAQTELTAGAGVIRDVIVIAGDASAPLADKMALYGAAAVMSPADRGRLDGMIEAASQRGLRIADGLNAAEGLGPFHTGGGTPLPAVTFEPDPNVDTNRPHWEMRPGVIPLPPSRRLTPGVAATGQVERGEISADDLHRTLAFGLLEQYPDMSINRLRNLLKCRQDKARELKTAWQIARREAIRADEPEDDTSAGQQVAQ